MKPYVKAKWLEALRSGRYRQGRGQLRRSDAYCCLGVLCEVMAAEVPESVTWKRVDDLGHFQACAEDEGTEGLPPTAVLRWSSLKYDEAGDLADLNDGRRKRSGSKHDKESFESLDFPQLADHIEGTL